MGVIMFYNFSTNNLVFDVSKNALKVGNLLLPS